MLGEEFKFETPGFGGGKKFDFKKFDPKKKKDDV
jgi:hypothetical protein